MQPTIKYIFLSVIFYSSFSYSDIQKVTYASWDKPDVELLYVLPKTVYKTKVLFIIHGGGRNVDLYKSLVARS